MSKSYYKYRDPDKTYGTEILYHLVFNVTDTNYLFNENFEKVECWCEYQEDAIDIMEDVKRWKELNKFIDSREFLDITHDEIIKIDKSI